MSGGATPRVGAGEEEAAASAGPGSASGTGSPLLRVVGVGKRFGRRVALREVGFELRAGELVALIGANGAGKTTLLSILAGVQGSDEGHISGSARAVGWVPQQPAVYNRLTVAENLALWARLERVPDPRATVQAMLEQTDLAGRADEQVARLSGGNRQRVNIALGLLSQPQALLLDEPSAALDPIQRERLWGFIGDLAARGTSVVFSTHNVSEAERYAGRVLVLDEGRLVFDGTPRELVQAAGAGEAPRGDFERSFVEFLRGRT